MVEFARKDNEFIAWYPPDVTREHADQVWRPRPAGYYVHIPYCTAICDYCGFAVDAGRDEQQSRYLDALETEIRRYADAGRLSGHELVCGHFGGGTPSVVDASRLMKVKALIDTSFGVAPDAEVTVEVNPISLTTEKARTYADAGVNRISFGVQSFDDDILRTIGRPHRRRDVEGTLEAIHQAGFVNYSLDIIYGVPGQSVEQLASDLELAAATGAPHLSCFRLEIIPFTALKLREAAGELPVRLSDEVLNEMDDVVHGSLSALGYRHYGSFNFARPGFENVHNRVAFMAPQQEYVGWGNSSYSFINDYVYCNIAPVAAYVDAVESGRDPIALARPVVAIDAMARFFVLGLKFHRVSRGAFTKTFGFAPEEVFGPALADLGASDMLVREGDDYVVTARGSRYINNVCKEFYVGSARGASQVAQMVPTLTAEQIIRYADRRDRNLTARSRGRE